MGREGGIVEGGMVNAIQWQVQKTPGAHLIDHAVNGGTGPLETPD